MCLEKLHLSKSAYYEHRSKYYNFRTKTWINVKDEVIMEWPSDSTDDNTKLLIQQLSHPLENIDGELHDGRQDVSLVFFFFCFTATISLLNQSPLFLCMWGW